MHSACPLCLMFPDVIILMGFHKKFHSVAVKHFSNLNTAHQCRARPGDGLVWYTGEEGFSLLHFVKWVIDNDMQDAHVVWMVYFLATVFINFCIHFHLPSCSVFLHLCTGGGAASECMKFIFCKLQFMCHFGKHVANQIRNDSSDWMCHNLCFLSQYGNW